jgi:hypothetical protein
MDSRDFWRNNSKPGAINKNSFRKGFTLIGTWEKQNDTLILRPDYVLGLPQEALPKKIHYLVNGRILSQLSSSDMNPAPQT